MRTATATALSGSASLLRGPLSARFDPSALARLPEPVRRYLTAAIAPGTPLWSSATLRMRGTIRIGLWVPFHAQQLLAPHAGFVWWGRAGGVITGHDRYVGGAGDMRWKLLGALTVVSGRGPDFDRSAIARPMGEAMWLPTALLPPFGVSWDAESDERIVASFVVHGVSADLRLSIDGDGRVRTFALDRWGDPDGTGVFGSHPFGGEATAHATFGDLTIPSVGEVGWQFGTERWPESAFFRYEIEDIRPTEADGKPR